MKFCRMIAEMAKLRCLKDTQKRTAIAKTFRLSSWQNTKTALLSDMHDERADSSSIRALGPSNNGMNACPKQRNGY